MTDALTERVRRRFESKFIPEPNSGCWLWTAGVKQYGYGRLWIDGHMKLAHRTAYEIYVGKIPDGLWLLHKCDNPYCVNPDHMFLGTHADNMADMVAKGRSAKQRGSSQGRAKLTESDVREILADNRSKRDIGRDYGVSETVIGKIKRREIWKHVSLLSRHREGSA